MFTAADLDACVKDAWHAVAGKDVPDTPGSATYRSKVGAAMVARAWTQAGTEARNA